MRPNSVKRGPARAAGPDLKGLQSYDEEVVKRPQLRGFITTN